MSKILRRPMFRGGPVNSEGTGITSGLNNGYANGGRIGYEEPTEENNFNLVTPSNDMFMRSIYGNDYTSQNLSNIPVAETQAERIARQREESNKKIREYNQIIREEQGSPTTNIGVKSDTGLPMTPRARLGLEPTLVELAKKEGFDISSGTAAQQGDKRKAFEEYLKNKETKKNEPPNLDSKVLADTYGLFNKPTATKEVVNEDEQFDKFYNRALKSLGGEKADRQAIFDAMLAASPAFFKGKNLREAAPNIFESISKSGAFDRPQKIRQAAAELALTRQITLEKIKEQEKARADLLGQKMAGPQTLQNDIAKIQANFKAGPNPLSITGVAPVAIKGIAISQLDKNPEASAYIDKQEKGKLILVEDPQGNLHYIAVTRKDPKTNRSAWSYVGQKGLGQTAPSLSSTDLAAYSSYKSPD
jgi:hypothetical protein